MQLAFEDFCEALSRFASLKALPTAAELAERGCCTLQATHDRLQITGYKLQGARRLHRKRVGGVYLVTCIS